MALKSILISAGDTWVAPLTVSGVFLYEVGGGSGANCSDDGSGRSSGGAGSAEFCGMKPVAVVPGNSYVVTIGAGGIGGASDFTPPPAPGGYSEFAGFKALTGGVYLGGLLTGNDSTGSGGGCGFGRGLSAGDGGSWPDNQPKQEAMHYWGGACGQGGTDSAPVGPSSSGGVLSTFGTTVFPVNGGGGGAGSIWGATNGGNTDGGGSRTANANPAHYGCGAGGTGGSSEESGGADGGNGAGGCVVLMWFE